MKPTRLLLSSCLLLVALLIGCSPPAPSSTLGIENLDNIATKNATLQNTLVHVSKERWEETLESLDASAITVEEPTSGYTVAVYPLSDGSVLLEPQFINSSGIHFADWGVDAITTSSGYVTRKLCENVPFVMAPGEEEPGCKIVLKSVESSRNIYECEQTDDCEGTCEKRYNTSSIPMKIWCVCT